MQNEVLRWIVAILCWVTISHTLRKDFKNYKTRKNNVREGYCGTGQEHSDWGLITEYSPETGENKQKNEEKHLETNPHNSSITLIVYINPNYYDAINNIHR